jgi:hypothetical protein
MVGLHHHSHKDRHVAQVCKPNGQTVPSLGPPTPTKHDDDAISVSAPLMLGGRCSYPRSISEDYSSRMPLAARANRLLTTAHLPLSAHPPPSFLCHICPIYLRTLALLI